MTVAHDGAVQIWRRSEQEPRIGGCWRAEGDVLYAVVQRDGCHCPESFVSSLPSASQHAVFLCEPFIRVPFPDPHPPFSPAPRYLVPFL